MAAAETAAAQFISVDAPCEVRDACVAFAREALAATPVSCRRRPRV
jgi:hypothetical protein